LDRVLGGGIVAGAALGSVVPIVGTALGALGGGIVGAFSGELIGHQALSFPPIWSKIQIRMYRDGRVEAQLLQHSLFPSLTFYRQSDAPSGLHFDRVDYSKGQGYYNATKAVQLPDWKTRGWGHLEQTSSPRPVSGNPWGIGKGVTGGADVLPN